MTVIEVRREDAQKLALEMWKAREDGEPWEATLAPNRDAYTVFAIYMLAEWSDADALVGRC